MRIGCRQGEDEDEEEERRGRRRSSSGAAAVVVEAEEDDGGADVQHGGRQIQRGEEVGCGEQVCDEGLVVNTEAEKVGDAGDGCEGKKKNAVEKNERW